MARTITNPANDSDLDSSVIRTELQTLETEIANTTTGHDHDGSDSKKVLAQNLDATTGNVPDNSVGTASIEDDAVTSAKIENQEAWNTVGAVGKPAFQNSWTNVNASNSQAGYMKDSLGFVHIKGYVKSGTIPSTIFTLPAGYIPLLNLNFCCMSNGAFGSGYINATNGDVVAVVGSNVSFGLDNISFKAEQ